MDYFLTYAGSVSFRELKNAIKKYFFLNLGGVGAKTRFLSKKNWGRYWVLQGKILGQLALYTWVPRTFSLSHNIIWYDAECFRKGNHRKSNSTPSLRACHNTANVVLS